MAFVFNNKKILLNKSYCKLKGKKNLPKKCRFYLCKLKIYLVVRTLFLYGNGNKRNVVFFWRLQKTVRNIGILQWLVKCAATIYSKNTIISGQMTSPPSPRCSTFWSLYLLWMNKASKRNRRTRESWSVWYDWRLMMHGVIAFTRHCLAPPLDDWPGSGMTKCGGRFKWKEIGSVTCYWTVRQLCHIACD